MKSVVAALVSVLIVSVLVASSFGARCTGQLDDVTEEVQSRYEAAPPGKLRNALEASLAALAGPRDPDLASDAAALRFVAAKASRLYRDPSDPIHGMLLSAFEGLRSDVQDERERFATEVDAQPHASLRRQSIAALRAADAALGQSAQETRTLAARAARLSKALKVVERQRSRFRRRGVIETMAMTAGDAVRRAECSAKAWSSDAILFAVVGGEHPPGAGTPRSGYEPGPPKEGDLRTFPCGRMDLDAWRILHPEWNGEDDTALDGRITAWQVVYFSFSKNGGMAVIVRAGRANVCVADPLTELDRQQLAAVGPTDLAADSPALLAALRAHSDVIDQALAESNDVRITYGIDLRSAATWGIKGQVPDRDVTFYATVSASDAAIVSIQVGP